MDSWMYGWIDGQMDGIMETDGQMDLLCITFAERQMSLPPPTHSSDII